MFVSRPMEVLSVYSPGFVVTFDAEKPIESHILCTANTTLKQTDRPKAKLDRAGFLYKQPNFISYKT